MVRKGSYGLPGLRIEERENSRCKMTGTITIQWNLVGQMMVGSFGSASCAIAPRA